MNQPFLSSLLALFVALLPIANPIGAVPIFYSLTVSDSKAYRHRQARQTAINVVLVLVAFLLVGRLILSFFGISLGVLQIAGGLTVAHTAWEMVTAKPKLTDSEHQEAIDKEDISFTPMAIPIVSGPGAIGVVIGLSERFASRSSEGSQYWIAYSGYLIGIALFGMVLYLCLALGEPLIRAMGKNGIGAMSRVLGFLILAIAVEMIANGTIAFIRQSMPELLK